MKSQASPLSKIRPMASDRPPLWSSKRVESTVEATSAPSAGGERVLHAASWVSSSQTVLISPSQQTSAEPSKSTLHHLTIATTGRSFRNPGNGASPPLLILTERANFHRTSDPEKQQEAEELDVSLCQHSEEDKEAATHTHTHANNELGGDITTTPDTPNQPYLLV